MEAASEMSHENAEENGETQFLQRRRLSRNKSNDD
jgi:hypothetical protein